MTVAESTGSRKSAGRASTNLSATPFARGMSVRKRKSGSAAMSIPMRTSAIIPMTNAVISTFMVTRPLVSPKNTLTKSSLAKRLYRDGEIPQLQPVAAELVPDVLYLGVAHHLLKDVPDLEAGLADGLGSRHVRGGPTRPVLGAVVLLQYGSRRRRTTRRGTARQDRTSRAGLGPTWPGPP